MRLLVLFNEQLLTLAFFHLSFHIKNFVNQEMDDVRPALGAFKEQLTKSLQIEGIIQEEGGLLSFLRTGYKTTTWWEEERQEASDDWKT